MGKFTKELDEINNSKCYDRSIVFCLLVAVVFAYIGNINRQKRIDELQAQLNDPEYCIEQCSMAFEIMGC